MLNCNEILSASFADILFQDRNKEYGAYRLRKDYPRHLCIALAAMAAFMGICVWLCLIGSNQQPSIGSMISSVGGHQLVEPPTFLVVPSPPPAPAAPRTKAVPYTAFRIVREEETDPKEIIPTVDDLQYAAIGTSLKDGDPNAGLAELPAGTTAPVNPTLVSITHAPDFHKIEISASFPGGPAAWVRYLHKHLRYPDEAVEAGLEAVVRVQFVVDREGSISDVHALNNPGGGLAEEAVRIIKRGPRWIPAEQNGTKVVYRHVQAIVFRLQ